MHTLRIMIGAYLALALSALSIVCCYLFGTHLAPGQEGQIYGVMGGTADALKAVLPLGIAAALASRQRGRAAIGAILFAVFSCYSFASELGLYALSRDAQASTTNAGHEEYRLLKDERAHIQERLKAFGQTRPSKTVNAEIAGQLQNKLWGASRQCSSAFSTSSRAFCAGVDRLRAELATAEESEALRAKDNGLAAKLSGMNLADVLRSADAQSEALSRLTGFAPSSIKDGLAILVALLIELGSGFGLYAVTAAHVGEKTQKAIAPQLPVAPSPARNGAIACSSTSLLPRTAAKLPADPVRQFAKAALRPSPGKAVAAADLHSAFTRFAQAEGLEQLGPLAFGRRLTALKYSRVKRGGLAHYADVEIAPALRLN